MSAVAVTPPPLAVKGRVTLLRVIVSEWTKLSRSDLVAWCERDPGQLYKLIAIEVWGRIFAYREPWQNVRVEF